MIEINNERLIVKSDLNITKNEAFSLAAFIDDNLIRHIRDDVDIDSMQWLRNMVHSYEKLCVYSGYVGLTDDTAETCDGDTYPITIEE